MSRHLEPHPALPVDSFSWGLAPNPISGLQLTLNRHVCKAVRVGVLVDGQILCLQPVL